MPSFSIPLTGLEADSTALNTIGNNLANLNTTAFKKQTTTFEDLFYQQIGSNGANDQLQVGAGVKVSGTQSSFLQGSLDTTSDAADMALAGDGFFVVQDGDVQSLTRAGNFQLDKAGNLITTDGQSVMGFAASNGTVNASGSLTPITIPINGTGTAKATSTFSVDTNLNSSAAVGTSFNTSVTMYDSLGQSHIASVSFTKNSANTWGYSVTLPAGDATGTPTNNTGTLTFSSSGVLTSPTSNLSGITFPGLTDGASDLSFNWQLYGSSGSPLISESASTSTATSTSQDGYASGTYQSFSVDSTGAISATFSNGQVQQVGQVAIAAVPNEDGLTRVGNNNFQTSAASGVATFAAAGVGSRGTIEDETLEESNVDISTEFSDLIVAQRAFQANSKTVTTFDQVTEDAISMVR